MKTPLLLRLPSSSEPRAITIAICWLDGKTAHSNNLLWWGRGGSGVTDPEVTTG